MEGIAQPPAGALAQIHDEDMDIVIFISSSLPSNPIMRCRVIPPDNAVILFFRPERADCMRL